MLKKISKIFLILITPLIVIRLSSKTEHVAVKQIEQEITTDTKITFIGLKCHEAAYQLGPNSPLSSIQKTEYWKDLQGKAFKWEMQLIDIDRSWGKYKAHLKCNPSNSYTEEVVMTFPPEIQNQLMELQKGHVYSFEGKIEAFSNTGIVSATAIIRKASH